MAILPPREPERHRLPSRDANDAQRRVRLHPPRLRVLDVLRRDGRALVGQHGRDGDGNAPPPRERVRRRRNDRRAPRRADDRARRLRRHERSSRRGLLRAALQLRAHGLAAAHRRLLLGHLHVAPRVRQRRDHQPLRVRFRASTTSASTDAEEALGQRDSPDCRAQGRTRATRRSTPGPGAHRGQLQGGLLARGVSPRGRVEPDGGEPLRKRFLDCCGAPTTASCVLDPPPLANPPVKHCITSSANTCREVGQSCLTTSQCCNAVDGGVCANGVCANPPSYYLDATYTREYSHTCLPGYAIRWGLFEWQSITPTGTSVQFSAQTGDGTTWSPASPLHFATASGASVLFPSWASSGTTILERPRPREERDRREQDQDHDAPAREPPGPLEGTHAPRLAPVGRLHSGRIATPADRFHVTEQA